MNAVSQRFIPRAINFSINSSSLNHCVEATESVILLSVHSYRLDYQPLLGKMSPSSEIELAIRIFQHTSSLVD